MQQRIWNLPVIPLISIFVSIAAGEPQWVFGAEMAIPPKLAAGEIEKSILIASAAQTVGGDAMAGQETRSADAIAEPQATVLESRSITSLQSRKQRRRKPKMAGVPGGPQVVVQETGKSVLQETAVQETQKTGVPVKPQAAQETEETENPFAPAKPQVSAQGTEETNNSFAAAKPQAAAQATKTGGGAGKKYRMAPIRWIALVSETLSWLRSSASQSMTALRSSNFTNAQTAEIKASSYIMKPYIAKVRGRLGILSSSTTTSLSTIPQVTTEGRSRNNKLYGDGRLSLFSQSRFPFDMEFGVFDINANMAATSNNTSEKRFMLDQAYRPLNSRSSFKGAYKNDSINGNRTGNISEYSRSSSFLGSYNTVMGSDYDQTFATSVTNSKSNNSYGNDSATRVFTVAHKYLPVDSLLSLTTNASLIRSSQSRGNLNAPGASLDSRYTQVNTYASWQPEAEDVPLFVSGSGQFLKTLTTENTAVSTSQQSLGGSIAAIYNASRNLTYRGNGSVVSTSNNGLRLRTSTQSGNVTYRANPVSFWNKSSYIWGTSGGLLNTTGSKSNREVFGSVNHGLVGPFSLNLFGKKRAINYGVTQSLAGSSIQSIGFRGTLVNSGKVSMGLTGKNGKPTGSASAFLTDTHYIGKWTNQGSRRALGMQANESVYEGYGAKAGMSLEATQVQGEPLRTMVMGQGSYEKRDFFGVRRLLYRGDLNLATQTQTYTTFASNNQPGKISYRLNQSLSYRVGLNEMQLVSALSDQYGVKNASLLLLFRAWRIVAGTVQ